MIVGTPSTLTFSLVAPSGVTYSSPTVTVESNPWATASLVTDNGDGTYSITITPDREIQAIIKLKVVQDAQTFYHSLMTQASAPLTILNPTTTNAVGNGNIEFDLSVAADGIAKVWDLRQQPIINTSSITLTPTAGATVAFVSGNYAGNFARYRITGTQTWTTGDQYKLTWAFNVVHPLSKVSHPMTYVSDHYKTPVFTWVSTGSVTAGVEYTLQFTAKFASGNPVRGLVLKPTVVAGVTIDPNIVVIDENAGLYGVKVVPAFANFTINPQVAIGNGATISVGARAFTSVAGATVTLAAMAATTRTIGVKLAGATPGDVITAVSGGAIMDAAIGGPWTPTANGVIFVPLPASNRTRPANTNTTPNTTDTINITYTRGGQSYTVPCQIAVVWLHAKVTAFSLTSNALQFSGTVGGADASWSFGACTFISETGVSLGTAGSTTVNNIGTTGKVVWNMTSKLADQNYVAFQSGGVFSGSNFTYWCEPFEIVRDPYIVMSSVEWDFSMPSGDAGKVIDLGDLIRTFKDDKGVPITGLSLNTIPGVDNVSGFRGIYQPRLADAGDWSKVIVPVTDGSDGRYYIRVSSTGRGFQNYWVPVFSSTFIFNTNEYGPKSHTFGSRIN